VRDFPIAGKPCYLTFLSRRFKCEGCGKPFTESLSAIAPESRYTRRYEQYLFAACRGRSLQQVHRLLLWEK